jgi:hypothetical protein
VVNRGREAIPERGGEYLKMNNFLPKDYELPESERRYTELEEGGNTLRILSPAIVGYEWWVDTDGGGRTPIRVRTAEEVPSEVRNATESQDKAKHFWSFTVYNYATQSIQVLEVKQQTIMRALDSLVKNPKWGSPLEYDVTIEKVKTGSRDFDVEYHVIPEPPSPLDEGIAELAKQVPVRLEALYDGQDPFGEREAQEEEQVKTNTHHRSRQRARAYS